jgi:ABC-type multidrug transport system ATPase subunit
VYVCVCAGYAEEGQILGIMGPSGSGKTTLLSILSSTHHNLAPSSRLKGHVDLNGQRRRATLRKVSQAVVVGG